MTIEIPKVENLENEETNEEFELEEDFELDFSDEESSDPDDVNNDVEIPEVTDEEDDVQDDETAQDSVQGNLSKAVKAKNKTIQELKEKMAKLEEAMETAGKDPYDIKLDQSTTYVGPKTQQIESDLERWEAYFGSPQAEEVEYDNPTLFRQQRATYNRLTRTLPKVERQERLERETMKTNKQKCLDAIMKANPDYDTKDAQYVFNTADFTKDSINLALKKAAKKWNDFVDSRISKRSSKGSVKKRMVKGQSKQSGIAPDLKGAALYNKAHGVMKKDKAHYNEMRVLYPGDKFKEYIKENAQAIIKGE